MYEKVKKIILFVLGYLLCLYGFYYDLDGINVIDCKIFFYGDEKYSGMFDFIL